MKIEMGESLLQSYFKCVESCLITQTNWKVSSAWKITDEADEKIKILYEKIQNHPDFKYVFKQNSLEQAIKQAELDVIGISGDKIYMAEVAFHENGLQYGDKEKTNERVCKKLLRAYLIGLAYFPNYSYEIMFVSPKVNPATEQIINEYFSILKKDFVEEKKVDFKYIANEEFKEKILLPTMQASFSDADTSELFLRSVKMLELFGLVNKEGCVRRNIIRNTDISPNVSQNDDYGNLKVGEIARTVLRPLLESGKIPDYVIEKLQDGAYSKQFFHIQYPLLIKKPSNYTTKLLRYYSNPLKIGNEWFLLCSEWYETSANNDRPHLIKWIKDYSGT